MSPRFRGASVRRNGNEFVTNVTSSVGTVDSNCVATLPYPQNAQICKNDFTRRIVCVCKKKRKTLKENRKRFKDSRCYGMSMSMLFLPRNARTRDAPSFHRKLRPFPTHRGVESGCIRANGAVHLHRNLESITAWLSFSGLEIAAFV